MIKKGLALSPAGSRFAPLFFRGDLKKGVETAAKLGFDGVEISVGNPERLDGRAIKAMISDLDLEIVTVATGQSYVDDGLPLVTDDAVLLERALERLHRVIDFAGDIGSRNVTLGGIRGNAVYGEHDEMVKRLVEPLRICARFALERGLGILLEPVNRYEVSTIFRMDQAESLMKMADSGNISLLYDVYHANIEEESIVAPLGRHMKVIGAVHFADSNRLVPLSGHIPFFEVARCLSAHSYSGYVTIEALPEPEDDLAAVRAIKALDLLWER